MRLSQKLLLFMLAAAVIPLSFAGFWLLREAERELSARLEREQRALAAASAEAAGTQLAATLESLAQSSSLIDWSKVSPVEAEGGLQLLSSQSPVVVSAALSSNKAFVGPRDDRPQLKIDGDELLALLPLSTLGSYGDRGQLALGAAQDSAVGPWMPAAIQVGPRGSTAPMVVVALTLTVLDRWLVEHAPPMTMLEIVDSDGRVIASSQWHQKVARLDEGRLAALRSGLPLVNSATEQLAMERVPGKLGLTAIASIPLDVARAPIRSLRRSVLGGMGATLVLLVFVSLVFARRLSMRLESLSSVATAYGKGELTQRITLTGGDELTELGRTFNAMGAELELSRARLLTWNDELKTRVDEATAELRAAQAQLLEAQKLAAIGQLGAGVAHEINNPLVGILGNAQLLLMDTPETNDNFALLKQIEQSAQRCREITQQLLRFSQKRGEVSLAPMDLNSLVTRAMSLEKDRSPGVNVVVQLSSTPTRIDGDSEQIEQVLAQLCANARTAMKLSPEKTLRVEVNGTSLSVRDSGKGIAADNMERIFEPFFTTKDVWTNIGLGLAVAYRVMQEHEGRIEVFSAPGQGATFVLHFKPEGTTQRKAASSATGIGGQGKGITG